MDINLARIGPRCINVKVNLIKSKLKYGVTVDMTECKEAALYFGVLCQALDDLPLLLSNRPLGDITARQFAQRNAAYNRDMIDGGSALRYLSQDYIPHAEAIGLDSDYIRRLMKKAGVIL